MMLRLSPYFNFSIFAYLKRNLGIHAIATVPTGRASSLYFSVLIDQCVVNVQIVPNISSVKALSVVVNFHNINTVIIYIDPSISSYVEPRVRERFFIVAGVIGIGLESFIILYEECPCLIFSRFSDSRVIVNRNCPIAFFKKIAVIFEWA